MTIFYSSYCTSVIEDDGTNIPIAPGWYICSDCFGNEEVWALLDEYKPFSNQRDCDIAIRSLSEAGIDTEEALENLEEEKTLMLCYGNLLW